MKNFLAIFFLFSGIQLFSQEVDPLQRMADSLEALNNPAHDYTTASFKGTRVINFPTIETVGKSGLDFRIAHRFGEFNDQSGNLAYNAFGLDGGACIRLSLDYGVNDRLMVGVGRTSLDKMADASFKYKVTRQTTDNHMPISVTVMEVMNYTFIHDPNKAVSGIDKYKFPIDRLSYVSALVIGRKFSEKLSFELNGFYVHYNIVDHVEDKNDIIAVGFSARYKLKSRVALTIEYAHRMNKYTDPVTQKTFYDPLGIGIDLETGGHVFQMHFTNQFGMNEAQYIPYTRSNWMKLGFRLGFNISRVFATGHHDKNSY